LQLSFGRAKESGKSFCFFLFGNATALAFMSSSLIKLIHE
jgi:hypothetical protein